MSSECWNPIYHIGPEFVLCGSSALEFMGLFAGYINASTVYVYQIIDTDKAVPKEYTVIPLPERKIEYAEKNGIKYTTFEQAVNDMLSDSRLEAPQALMEALNDYLYTYGRDDPHILPENIPRYEYCDVLPRLKLWASLGGLFGITHPLRIRYSRMPPKTSTVMTDSLRTCPLYFPPVRLTPEPFFYLDITWNINVQCVRV